jgi:chromosomal replication initiator protein
VEGRVRVTQDWEIWMQGVVRDDNEVVRRESLIAEPRSAGGQELAVADRGSASVDAAKAIARALADRIGQDKYRIWFQSNTRFSCVEEYLKIGVPNLFMARWLENHFLKDVKAAAFAATGGHPNISFVVDSGLCGARPSFNVRPAAKEHATSGGGVEAQDFASLQSGRGMSADASRAPAPRTTEKVSKYTLDTFVVGPSNQLAHSAAAAVVHEQQSPFNPLFIHGGSGVGKTHLLHGICNGVVQARPQTNWLYMSAEEFANQFVLALKTKKLEAFRHRMRQTDLLAIDDVHFLASKPSTQEEFLHTFNTISLAGKQVILVSDAHPKQIGQLSEKLVNRFVSGMVVKIEPPDFQTRCEICRRFSSSVVARRPAKPAGEVLPEAVIRYVAERIQTNVRELEGAMLKLVAFASLTNDKVTLAMAQQVLAEHVDRCERKVHVPQVETAVASYFGTTPAHIHSTKKDRTVSLARHFSMYLTRKHTNMSSSEVGRVLGGKNHATVLMACRKVEQMLQRDEDIHWQSPTGNRVAKARSVLSDLEACMVG